jgi:hypothetical protein
VQQLRKEADASHLDRVCIHPGERSPQRTRRVHQQGRIKQDADIERMRAPCRHELVEKANRRLVARVVFTIRIEGELRDADTAARTTNGVDDGHVGRIVVDEPFRHYRMAQRIRFLVADR